MNKKFIAIGLAALIPVAVLAAGDHRGERHGGPDIARMAGRLDLNTEQQDRLRALFEAHREERKAMREKMRTSMAEVLTPEQLVKMESMREERKERRKERHGKRKHHRHGGGQGEDCRPGEDSDKS